MSSDQVEDRLGRVEDKVDSLIELHIANARHQEQIKDIKKDVDIVFDNLRRYGDEIEEVSKLSNDTATAFRPVKSVAYGLVALQTTLLVAVLLKLIET